MENIIALTYFNRGQAGKIFEDTIKNGSKLVTKNGHPYAVILSVEEYDKLTGSLGIFKASGRS